MDGLGRCGSTSNVALLPIEEESIPNRLQLSSECDEENDREQSLFLKDMETALVLRLGSFCLCVCC